MKIVGVIPARYGSTRLKAKILADILGKPMVQYVWERAKQSKLLDDLIIACDDEVIRIKVKEFGAKVAMTSRDHASGTDRIAEAVASLNTEIVVNIQGDEPLVHHTIIDDLARCLLEDKSCLMATVIKKIDNEDDLDNPNIVKAVIDKNKCALYFSRSAIPYNRDKMPWQDTGCYKHLGLYAYRKEFLMGFKSLPKSRLEKVEQLEQLRVLEAGYKIKTVETTHTTISVDTQEDLHRVEDFLRKNGTD